MWRADVPAGGTCILYIRVTERRAALTGQAAPYLQIQGQAAGTKCCSLKSLQ